MAKRNKRVKKTYRRRRVSGLGKLNANNPLVKFGSIALGYVFSDKINDALDSATGGKMDGKLMAGLEVFAGLAANGTLPVLGKKKPGLAMTLAGGVLAGAGAKRGLTEFGIISGFSDVPVLGGYRAVPVLNGYNPTPGANMAGYKVPAHKSVMGGVPFDGTEKGDGSGLNEEGR